MKQTFLLFFIFIAVTACREIECEAFDFSRDVMNWHFFPDRQLEYLFESDSSTAMFIQTDIRISKYE